MYFTEGRTDLPREAIGSPGGTIASRGGSLPVFVLDSIATCDFRGGGGGVRTTVPSLDPPVYSTITKEVSISTVDNINNHISKHSST